MKTATLTTAAAAALTLALGVQGFVLPAAPRATRPRSALASVRLPQDAELVQSSPLLPSQQGEENVVAVLEAAAATAAVAPEAGLVEEKKAKRKGPAPVVVAEGDLLESTWEHRLHVGTHYMVTLALLQQVASAYVAKGGVTATDGVELAATLAFSLVFSDFFSGVFHWSVDNYGNKHTPVLGAVIEAFQGHHDAPWTITYREFSNNVHKITKITIPAMLAIAAVHPASPLITLFGAMFFNLQVLSQEFHKISHLTKPPKWATVLQDLGLIISRKEHGQHHSNPFESNYCILTGTCNKFMDNSGFFRVLERAVYEATGVRPNCWKLDESGELQVAALLGKRGGAAHEEQEQEEEK